ncbi:hypothetical protein Tco_0254485, partial [Tanacetum coccineum]
MSELVCVNVYLENLARVGPLSGKDPLVIVVADTDCLPHVCHGSSSVAASAGKSPTVLKKLLASSILNVESGVEAVATLPFVTPSISATPKHESGVPADSIIGLNLCTIGTSERSAVVPPVMTEAVITTHVASIPSATAPESGTKVITPVHAS